jgi:urease accessory protein UreH
MIAESSTWYYNDIVGSGRSSANEELQKRFMAIAV